MRCRKHDSAVGKSFFHKKPFSFTLLYTWEWKWFPSGTNINHKCILNLSLAQGQSKYYWKPNNEKLVTKSFSAWVAKSERWRHTGCEIGGGHGAMDRARTYKLNKIVLLRASGLVTCIIRCPCYVRFVLKWITNHAQSLRIPCTYTRCSLYAGPCILLSSKLSYLINWNSKIDDYQGLFKNRCYSKSRMSHTHLQCRGGPHDMFNIWYFTIILQILNQLTNACDS